MRQGAPGAARNLEHFVVGKVLEAVKHPNADKLQLTKVDVGERRAALDRLRRVELRRRRDRRGRTARRRDAGGDFTIEKRKLRGEVSEGMILSERELEIGQDHGGIMVLSDELERGHAARRRAAGRRRHPRDRDALQPARPDLDLRHCARGRRAARDASCARCPGTEPERDGDESRRDRGRGSRRCPRYIGRLFRDVRLGESPAWLKARLTGAGMRPISNVVDVTNYVMLALGNPLHAFDYDKLARRSHRRAPRAARARSSRRSTARCASSIRRIS